jgi:SAM-dependent methyltransferase
VVGGIRCEDLQDLTFADASLDVVVTQDVLEHIPDPARAFREVARVLRPGGLHVFTVPIYPGRATRVRVRVGVDGRLEHLEPPDYHLDPASPEGSLVIREWGYDIVDFIREACALETQVFSPRDRRLGLDGDFLDVFVTRRV